MNKVLLIALSFSFLALSACSDKRESDVDTAFNPGIVSPSALVAFPSTQTTNEDTPLSSTLPVAGSTSGNIFSLVTPPTHGTVSIVPGTGAYTYTPNAGYVGADSFSWKVSNGPNASTSVVNINVIGGNLPPNVPPQNFSTNEDTPLTSSIVANDPNGDTLTYILVSPPSHGTITIDPNTGVFTYVPGPNYNGTDSFVVKVNDGTVDSNTTVINIGINAVNDAPVAQNQNLSTPKNISVSGSAVATDVDGNALTFAVVANPTHGTLTLNSTTGAYTYIPNTNYVGTDSFTYKANDGSLDSNVATVSIIVVAGPNSPPVANNTTVNAVEDTPVVIPLSATDADGDTLTYIIVTPPAHGTLTGTGPNFTYTPDPNYFGPDSFVFKVNDGTSDSNTGTVSVNVAPVNDAPVANGSAFSVVQGGNHAGSVSATDVEGSPLTYSVVSGPTKGTLTFNSSGSYSYTPNVGATGTDSFSFKANDGSLDSNVALVNITITTSPNNSPIALNQTFTIPEDAVAMGNVIATDLDGDPVTYILMTGPTHGTLVLNPDGSFVYTPNANFNGSDSFTFKANDGFADSNVATITFGVTPVNDAPVAVSSNLTTNEDVPLTSNLVGTDIDGDSLTYVIVTPPTHGTVSLNATTGAFTYTPNANFSGSDGFTFKVNDGTVDSNVAAVSLSVNPVNDVPVVQNLTVTTNEDVPVNGNISFSDPDGPSISWIIVTPPTKGSVTITNASTGAFTYTPNPNSNGTDSFAVKINDGVVDSNVATVTINVVPVNDAPVSFAGSLSVDQGQSFNGTLSASDVDGDALTYSIVASPTKGTIVITNPTTGAFTYTANAIATGTDSFTFKVNDGVLDSNVSTVTVSLNIVNVPPVAQNASISTNEDTPYSSNLLGSDANGDSLTYAIATPPAHGSLSLNSSTGAYTYSPSPNYNGSDSFSFTVNDGVYTSNVATVSVNVTPVNDAPIANNQSVTTSEDVAANIVLVGNDVDGDSLTYTIVSGPSNGTLSGTGANRVYTPNVNFNGTDSFTYKVNDGTIDSNVATVSIDVTPANDAPVAANLNISTMEDTPVNVVIPAVDADGDTLTYVIVTSPTQGTISGTGPNFVYTPNANFHGSDSFTYKVNDGTVDSPVYTVSLSVGQVNDAPIANNQSVTTNEDVVANIVLVGTDVEGDALTYVVVSGPTNGTLSGSGANRVYTPNANFHGSDSFTFKVNDGSLDSNVATVSITVNSVEDIPVAQSQTVNTTEDVPVNITLVGTDGDGDPLTYVVTVPPTHGTLSGSGANLVYTPALNYSGTDSFVFVVNDGNQNSAPATVSINVADENDAPIAFDDSVTTAEDVAVNVVLTGFDADGNTLTYVVVTPPAHGTLSGTAPNLTYTPNANFNGSDSFTYKVNDGIVDSNVATVALTVTPVNDAPIASNSLFSIGQGQTHNGNLIATDVEGSPLTYAIVTPPTKGTLTLNPTTGSFTYTAGVLSVGSDSFTFKANDGTLDSNVATVAINLTLVNLAPVANNGSLNTNEDTPVSSTLTYTDLNGDSVVFSIVTGPLHGSVTLNSSTGVFTYTPSANYHGPDSFTFKVNDGVVDSNVATISIGVNSVNDAPIAASQNLTVNEDQPLNVTLTATDADGDTLTYIIVTPPSHGTLSGSGANIVYSPNANYNGPDSFSFKANDGVLDSNVATISIGVSPVNDAPVASNQSISTNEDVALNITLTATDVDGNALTYTVISGPTNGTLTGAGANRVYTPNANYNGPDSFTFKVNDGIIDSNVATVSINVVAVNDAPVAMNGSGATPEDTLFTGQMVVNDIDGDVLSYMVLSQPLNGVLNYNASTGSFTYLPNENFNGTDQFTFVSNDGVTSSNVATFVINVTPVNDAPIANNQSIITDEDVAVNITLSATDVDGNALTYVIVTPPSHGTISGSGANIVYTPASNFHGADSFTFKANDGTVDSNVATVSINVNSQNDGPLASDVTTSTSEDVPVVVTIPAVDDDGDTLTYIIVTPPANGTLSGTGPDFTYTPDLNYNGPDSFVYKLNDGTEDSPNYTVSITVTPVNDAPVANNQAISTNEDVAANITLVGSDVDGDALTYVIVSGPTNGTLSGSGVNRIYTPNPNFNGTDSFTFKVNDGTIDSNVATVSISVNSVNDAPTASNLNIVTAEETPVNVVIPAFDADGDALTYIIVSAPSNGVISGTGPNFVYTPNMNFNGSDSFTYKVNDGTVDSPVYTVSLSVTPVNDAPIANNLSVTTNEDVAANITLSASDVDGDALTYIIVSGPSSGTLSGTGANRVYTPNANFNGSDSFTFRVNDGTLNSNVATVSITVSPVNDAPSAANLNISTAEDTPVNVVIPAVDADGDSLTYVIVTPPSQGVISGTGPNFVYTPNANFNGSELFTYKVNDGTVDSPVYTVSISVTPVNDAPIALNQNLSTDEDQALNITLGASDVDGDTLTYIIVSGPAHGTLTGSGANRVYTPNPNYSGSDSFTYKVNDGTVDSNVATVSILIDDINYAPTAQNSSGTVLEDQIFNGQLLAADLDGDALTYILVSPPAHGSIVLDDSTGTFVYTPNANYNGSDSFTFLVSDGVNLSNVGTFSLTITPVNDTPVAQAQSVTTAEDVAANITLVANDVDGNTLTYTIVSGPTNGTLSGSGANVVYTPNANFNGSDSFTFKANDGTIDSNVATVSITVTPVNDAPTAANIAVNTNEDVPVNILIPAVDADGDALTYVIVTPPAHGTLTGTGPNFTYTPAPNYFGTDSFVYKVNDGTVDSPVYTASVVVAPVNDIPVANAQTVTTNEDVAANITLTGSDADGDTLTYVIVTPPSHGTLSGSAANVVYTPNANYHGSDSFVFKVNDGTVDSATATVAITVNSVNDAPTSADVVVTTNEDVPANITLLGNDADGDTLTYVIVVAPTQGTLSGTGANVVYTPNANFNGTDSFTYKVNDGTLDSNVSTVTINVTAVNDAPIAQNQTVNTNEDVAANIVLVGTDADGDTLAYVIVTPPAHGTLTGTGANRVYTPNANYNGPDSFTFKVNDGTVDSNVATVTLNIAAVNDAPVAQNQTVNTNEDVAVNITAVATDVDGNTLTYAIVTPPAHGTLTGTGPNFTYTPNANYHGSDSFTFKANDGTVDSNVATITLNVTPVNDAPTASNVNVTTNEDVPANITLLGNDVDGDTLTYVIVSGPAHGTLTGTGANRVYTPNANYHGSDSFVFKVNDGTVDSTVATVSITVAPVNDAPVAQAQSVTTAEDVAANITLVGTDVDGNTITYVIVTPPAHGTLTGTGANRVYTPNANYNGPDSFVFKVNDGTVDSANATVSITVTPVNDAPVANNQSVTTAEDVAANITLSATDVDGDSLTYVIVTPPSHGTLTGTGANRVYTPNANYHGPDSFTFRANDGTLNSNIATVSISVTPVNDAPVVNNGSFTIAEDTVYNGTLSGSDVDGDVLTYSVATPALNGVVVITNSSTGAFTYTPNLNFAGADSFTFSVNDGTVDSNIATMNVTVTPVNDAPVASNSSFSVNSGAAHNGQALATDVDSPTLTYTLVTSPTKGTIVFNPNGSFVYTANASQSGPDSFTFRSNDGSLNSNIATVSINIVFVNTAPVANNGSFTTPEDTLYSGTLAASDVDGQTLTYAVVTAPTKGTLTITNVNTGAFTYTPNLDYNGSDSFTFRVNDGFVNSNTATMNISVTPVNDAPVAYADTVTTPEDQAVAVVLSGYDAESSPLTYTIVSGPAHGTLTGTAPNLTYTPTLNYNGPDSFTFRVNDGSLNSNVATISITVTPVNDAPVAQNKTIAVSKNTPKNETMVATDVDGNALTYSVVTAPTKGTVTITNAATGAFTYTPNNNAVGADSFTFRANDGTVNSNTATISINITNPNNQAPIAQNQNLFGTEDTTYTGNMPSWDPDGDVITWTVITQPSNGVLNYSTTTGNFTFVPALNYCGSVSFTYKVNDGFLDSPVATTVINLQCINDLPVANAQSVTVLQNSSGNAITLVGSDVETPEPSLVYSVVNPPTKGTLTGSGKNRIYTPNLNATGTDTFTFKVNDGQYDSNIATVTITIDDNGGWCNPSYAYMHKLMLNNQDQNQVLTNFPIMVKLNSSRVNYSDIKAGGADIRFFDSNCNSLAYEIERWDTGSDSFIWVKVPSIAASSNASFIWMGYGNPSAVDGQNKTAVWDSSYKSVWHLEETTGLALDSTSNANNMTPNGTIVRNVGGRVAGAELFDSSADRLSAPSTASLLLNQHYTLEAWVYVIDYNSNANIIERQYNTSSGIDYGIYVVDGYPHMRAKGKSLQFNTRLPRNQWSHMVATFDTNSNTCRMYVNGVLRATSKKCTENLVGTGTMNVFVGGDHENRFFNGAIDEPRISSVVRSEQWIRAQHLSMTDGMVSYGSRRTMGQTLNHELMTIKATGDDGRVLVKSNSLQQNGSNGVIYQGADGGRPDWGYYRFQLPANIPEGATIKKVMLRLYGRDDTGAWANQFLVVTAQNTSNAAAITNSNQAPGASSSGVPTLATGVSWGAPGYTNWKNDDWNDSPNLKPLIDELKTKQSGLGNSNYVQLWITKGGAFGTIQAPLLSVDTSGNLNYLLGLSTDITVPTSPLINVGLSANLLNSLGLGGLQLCILNVVGINCNNTPAAEKGSEDFGSDTINHGQLMIEWEP